jgi:hypothetical protein
VLRRYACLECLAVALAVGDRHPHGPVITGPPKIPDVKLLPFIWPLQNIDAARRADPGLSDDSCRGIIQIFNTLPIFAMDHAARRTPAWKRLGLKLKNDQSGGETRQDENHVAEHQHGESHTARSGSPDVGLHASVKVQESSPSLGKRKHAAEDDGQIVKKSRKVQTHDSPHEEVGQTAPTFTQLDGGATAPTSKAADPSDKPRPKGDPNYRKKKGRKNDQHNSRKSAPAMVVETRPRTPSLSPGPPDQLSDGATLLVSTETDFPDSSSAAAHKSTKKLGKGRDSNSASSSLSPRIDRRKSVTFTPDTKTADGNSASNLFKKWAHEQKGSSAEFSQSEVVQFAPPPKSHPANDIPTPNSTDTKAEKNVRKAERKAKKSAPGSQLGPSDPKPQEAQQELVGNSEQTATTAVSGGKKKDTSRYTDYLMQYHSDRSNWKFNKAKQNDVLDNALNVFRIPEDYLEALIAYVKGLQGAGVIERLKQRCASAIEELDREIDAMDDAETRKAMEEEALQERLSKERKRRRLEGDVEGLLGHPHSDGYIRRLKRRRAQALMTALNLAAPAPAPAPAPVPRTNGISKNLSRKFSDSPEPVRPLVQRKAAKKNKQRSMNVSSDESSESSSSDGNSSESSGDSDDGSSTDSDGTGSESDSGSSASDKGGVSASNASSSDEAPDHSSSSENSDGTGSGSEDADSESDSD